MGSRSCRCAVLSWVLPALLLFLLVSAVGAQGLQTSPYSAPSTLRGSSSRGLDLAPSNPLGLPGSSATAAGGSGPLYLSEGMLQGILPLIPNLQFGYLYDFGNNRVSSGRFTADYLLPFSLSPDSMIFGEAHTEFQDFWKTSSFNNRVDMSFGGGYRTLLGCNTLLGVNGFYDTSRLGGTWYSSGSVGLEMAALIGSDAIDLNFNWYGQLFNSNVIVNAFRYGPSNYDFQVGYSHELWNGGPDLRLKMTGYEFDIGNRVYGWNAGAELKSRDGMFVVKYDVGHDKVNQTYQTVGGFVNVGFRLENLFKGESPFTMPEPIFRSPRSLRYMLTEKVKRDWHQSTAIVITRQGQSEGGVCNTDRVLDNVAMTPVPPGIGFGTAAPVQFAPVPVACLQTGRGIVVEIDYSTVSPNVNATLVILVDGTAVFNGRSLNVPNGAHTVSVPLTIPANRQDAFIAAGDDPIQIGIVFFDFAMISATVQEVRIRFNRP